MIDFSFTTAEEDFIYKVKRERDERIAHIIANDIENPIKGKLTARKIRKRGLKIVEGLPVLSYNNIGGIYSITLGKTGVQEKSGKIHWL